MSDATAAYQIIVYIFGVGMIISTLEYVSLIREFSQDGIYSWRVLRLMSPFRGRDQHLDSIVSAVYDERGVRVLLGLRLVGAMGLVIMPLGSLSFSIAACLLVIGTLLFGARQVFGEDGSDQLNSILAVTIFACVGPHSTPFILDVGLWFLALQLSLAYFSAGAAKVISRVWRSGTAVFEIFDTASYGHEPVARYLLRYPAISWFLSWSVISFELLFPLGLVLPSLALAAFLVWGVVFHLSCAAIMGLNNFVWSFVGTYPAMVYTAFQI